MTARGFVVLGEFKMKRVIHPVYLVRLIVLLLVGFFASRAFAVQQRVFFAPSATNPAISQFNSNHYAVVDPALTSRGRLVLFLPGTGATPFLYREFSNNAASLGFHVLALMYPNGSAINSLCAQNAPFDAEAAGNARREVIDGVDRVGFLSVDNVNCIESRLLKALQYLHTTYPAQGWGQYYSVDGVAWSKLVVSGHSQGAGMAAMLAKTRGTDRCIMFTDMDWWVAGGRPYNWMSAPPLTPVDRWYFFAHERDQFLDFDEMQTSAAALDVSRYGAFVRVEASASPGYGGRHFLSTNLEPAPAQAASYHGCPVVDSATPMQSDGVTPVLKPAWDYMLLHETPQIAIEAALNGVSIIFSPGTLEQSDDLVSWVALPAAVSPLSVPAANLAPRRFYRLRFIP